MSQPPEGLHFLTVPHLSLINRIFQKLYGLIVDLSIYWIRVTIFPSMSKAESSWVFETGFDPVNQL